MPEKIIVILDDELDNEDVQMMYVEKTVLPPPTRNDKLDQLLKRLEDGTIDLFDTDTEEDEEEVPNRRPGFLDMTFEELLAEDLEGMTDDEEDPEFLQEEEAEVAFEDALNDPAVSGQELMDRCFDEYLATFDDDYTNKNKFGYF